MSILRSVIMVFSMFSRIPTPKIEWKENNMRYMLAMLPLVGCVEAAVLFGWVQIAIWLNFGQVLLAAGMTLLPILFTGGVHLDGFCDTIDALSSHGDMEKKREILKDSHSGAFAVIFVCIYILFEFALFTEANREQMMPFCFIPILSRVVTGFAGVCFSGYGETGLLATFRTSASKKAATVILVIWFIALGVCIAFLSILASLVLLITAVLCCVYVYFMSRKQFGGMSGDIAGYLLQISELCLLIALILLQKVNVI